VNAAVGAGGLSHDALNGKKSATTAVTTAMIMTFFAGLADITAAPPSRTELK
jgi:hypothetical protein